VSQVRSEVLDEQRGHELRSSRAGGTSEGKETKVGGAVRGSSGSDDKRSHPSGQLTSTSRVSLCSDLSLATLC